MRAILLFERCREALQAEERLRMRMRQLREAMTFVGQSMNANGGSRAPNVDDKMAAFAAALDELECRLKARERRHSAEIVAACALLEGLTAIESAVMYAFYVSGKPTRVIASELNYTDGYIRNVKMGAEKKMRALDDRAAADCLPSWYAEDTDE